MEWLAASVLGLVVLALGSIVFHSLKVGISPMPSSAAAVKAVCALVPPETSGEIVELGAGWGTLAFALARHAPRAQVVACESSPVPFAVLWLRHQLLRRENLRLRFGNFESYSLTRAAVVICYLWPGAMAALSQRFRSELSPGAHIVSNTFGLRGWQSETEVQLHDLYRTRIYRYVR